MGDIIAESKAFLSDGQIDGEIDKLMTSGILLEDEDTVEAETQASADTPAIPTASINRSTGSPDYEALEGLAEKGDLYYVKNTASIPLIRDWDMELLPEDLKDEFSAFLNRRLNDFDLGSQKGFTVAFYINNRTVNFLHEFANSKRLPIIMNTRVGKNEIIQSRFVIDANEAVYCTKRQAESLRAAGLEKVKREIPREDGSVSYSSWTGFLMIGEVEKNGIVKGVTKDLAEVNRSMVSLRDLVAGDKNIAVKPIPQRGEDGSLVRAIDLIGEDEE